jgi:tRNA1(Val) A37 N6-methylase TrmN6
VAAQLKQKEFGAYYTSNMVADLLVRWAVRNQDDLVLDPSCGEGVFLEAAAARVSALEGRPSSQIRGIEIDPEVFRQTLTPLLRRFLIPEQNVCVSDFFEVCASNYPPIQAVVGNPPFIRYQTFKGPSREKALKLARAMGVDLPELASSWAPFLLHATEFLQTGGRLAMVVPAEFTHAGYARPVVQYFARKFARIQLASFSDRLFPELNEDTLLLLAEGYGGECREFRVKRFEGIKDFESALEHRKRFGARVGLAELQNTNGRLRNHFLPRDLKALYDFLAADSRVCRLGELAQVGIGYVTGNNQFFHLSRNEARRLEVPSMYLKRSLLRSGIIKGLRFASSDWAELRDDGEKVYLLDLPKVAESELPDAVRGYLAKGKGLGVHKAYKCAVRTPWFSVPHAPAAESFLTYMSGDAPRIVWNAAGVLATNSTHEVRLNSLQRIRPQILSLAFCSSLSQLSAEVEGHPLGGGMLKIEPSEAARTLAVCPELLKFSEAQFEEMDYFIRSNSMSSAIDMADELVLRGVLGLNWDQIQVLRNGLTEVREQRRKKIATSSSN